MSGNNRSSQVGVDNVGSCKVVWDRAVLDNPYPPKAKKVRMVFSKTISFGAIKRLIKEIRGILCGK